MKYERHGHRNARASAPSFPPEEEMRSASPSHADSSHVARRRPGSAPAYEVGLDEIELFEEDAPSGVRTTSAPPPLPPRSPVSPPLSLAPFDVPLSTEMPRRKSALPRAMAGVVLALAAGAAAGFLVQPGRDVPGALRQESAASAAAAAGPSDRTSAAPPTERGVAPALTMTVVPAEPAPQPPGTGTLSAPPAPVANVPVVEVAKLPRPTAGVVTGSPGHRLWIDGVLVAGWQASVACGPHTVQVGSAGAQRTVQVPCGETIFVSP